MNALIDSSADQLEYNDNGRRSCYQVNIDIVIKKNVISLGKRPTQIIEINTTFIYVNCRRKVSSREKRYKNILKLVNLIKMKPHLFYLFIRLFYHIESSCSRMPNIQSCFCILF